MNNKTFDDLLDLSLNETWRGRCPRCGHKDFTATNKKGDIVFNCFRVSCNTKGWFSARRSAADLKELIFNSDTVAKQAEPTSLPESIREADDNDVEYHNFKRYWGIEDVPTLIDVKDNRIVFPLESVWRSYKGNAIGRLINGEPFRQDKWYRYGGDLDHLLINPSRDYSNIIIVEDVISAHIARKIFGIPSIALLGTSLTNNHKAKLAEYSNMIIALDPDAYLKAGEMRQTLMLHTGVTPKVISLQDDIKYYNEIDIENIKREIHNARAIYNKSLT